MSEEAGDAPNTLRETQDRLRNSIAKARRIVVRARLLLGGEPRDDGPQGGAVTG